MDLHQGRQPEVSGPSQSSWFAATPLAVPSSVEPFQPIGLGGRGFSPALQEALITKLYPEVESELTSADRRYVTRVGQFLGLKDPTFGLLQRISVRAGDAMTALDGATRSLFELRNLFQSSLERYGGSPDPGLFDEFAQLSRHLVSLFRAMSDPDGVSFSLVPKTELEKIAAVQAELQQAVREWAASPKPGRGPTSRLAQAIKGARELAAAVQPQISILTDAIFAESCVRSEAAQAVLFGEYRKRWGSDPLVQWMSVPSVDARDASTVALQGVAKQLELTREALAQGKAPPGAKWQQVCRDMLSGTVELCYLAQIADGAVHDSSLLVRVTDPVHGGRKADEAIATLMDACSGLNNIRQRVSQTPRTDEGAAQLEAACKPVLKNNESRLSLFRNEHRRKIQQGTDALRSAFGAGLTDLPAISQYLKDRRISERFISSLAHLPPGMLEALTAGVGAVLLPALPGGKEAPPPAPAATPRPRRDTVSEVTYRTLDGEQKTLYLTPSQHRIFTFMELMRGKHVDTSLRNPLVNFRHSRGKNSIEIGLEDPVVIYERLVEKRKPVGFLETDDAQKAASAQGKKIKGLPDDKFQTVYDTEELEERLLSLSIEARKRFQEYGSSCLYLAMGMVHYESVNDKGEPCTRLAPLLLIPVTLGRKSINERYRITHSGSGPELNLALVARLKQEDGIEIPPLPTSDEFDLKSYIELVQNRLGAKATVTLQPEEMAVGLFLSGRFLMYHDLDFRNWPEGQRAWEANQPIVRALLGDHIDQDGPYVLEGYSRVDAFLRDGQHLHVSDCDSSQIAAMLAAEASPVTVVHGPPGTGKSQTIVNLIASAIAQGQSVLFVSKKLAALEVVRKRLEEAGLGEACLVLHSTSTSKTEVLRQLKGAFSLGEPVVDDPVTAELKAVRDRLNGYCDSLSTVVGRSGYTPYQVLEELLALGTAGRARIDFAPMRTWSREEFEATLPLVTELEENLRASGLPHKNVFYGSSHAAGNPELEETIRAGCADFQAKVEALEGAYTGLTSYIGGVEFSEGAKELIDVLEHISKVPSGDKVKIRSSCYTIHPKEVGRVGEIVAKCQSVRNVKGAALTDEAWTTNIWPMVDRALKYGRRSGFRNFFTWGAHMHRREVNALHKPDQQPKARADRLSTLLAIRDYQRGIKVLESAPQIVNELFVGGIGAIQDVVAQSSASAVIKWANGLYAKWGTSRQLGALLDAVDAVRDDAHPETRARLVRDIMEVAVAAAALGKSRTAVIESMKLSDTAKAAFEALSVREQHEKCAEWAAKLPELTKLASYNALRGKLKERGLGFLAEYVEKLADAPQTLSVDVRYSWLQGLYEWARHDRPILNTMERDSREPMRQKFCELDRRSLDVNRLLVNERLWNQIPRENVGGQTNVLSTEFSKARNLLEIRQLLGEAGQAVQRMAPVVMMSPEAAAKFLPAGGLVFDLLVGDELSQLLVEEALPAMMRAKRFAAFGDPQQMPPTTFFFASQGAETNGGDIEAEAKVSVLDVLLSRGVQKPVLSHAYRFQHQRLIQFSNEFFYEGALQVFASPQRGPGEMGLVYHHLPETVYERGVSGTNPKEALLMAEAVIRHAKASPERSLGVVAMSESQMKAIIKELERLREEDPSCEDFFDEDRPDAFFVKNLETVQGDERDVMMVSTGYGRDAQGKLSFNFGPINQDGGERRLNVLFSRARMRTEIFTNLTPEDFAAFRGSSQGVRALQAFLAYARDGTLPGTEQARSRPLSVLEQQIKTFLESQGFQVETDTGGTCGPELAVVDPKDPNRFCLGIFTDGERYQRRASVRDRERLVGDVLTGLGWRLHNVSVLDWYNNPEGEKETLKKCLSTEAPPSEGREARKAFVVPRRGALAATLSAAPILAYKRAELSFNETAPLPGELRRLARKTVQTEGPVHTDEVSRRIREAAGKHSDSFREAIDLAIKAEVMEREVQVTHGHFLSPAGTESVTIRNRNSFPATLRKISLISPDEIEAAILHVVGKSYGVKPSEIAEACCRFLFGFKSVPTNGEQMFEARLKGLLESGAVVQDGEYLRMGKGSA